MNIREIFIAAQLAARMSSGNVPAGALKLKGQADSVDELPDTGNTEGDVYIVGAAQEPEKAEYYWFGGTWNYLGETPVDLSEYVKSTDKASTSQAGVVGIYPNGGIVINDAGKILIDMPTEEQVGSESAQHIPLTLCRIPTMMENYGISSKTQLVEENAVLRATLGCEKRNYSHISGGSVDSAGGGYIFGPNNTREPVSIPAGKYIVSWKGTASSGASEMIFVLSNGSNVRRTIDNTSSVSFELTFDLDVVQYAMFTNKPNVISEFMIRPADIADPSFFPFTLSVNERLAALEAAVGGDS